MRPPYDGCMITSPPPVPMNTPQARRTTIELVMFSCAVIAAGLALQAFSPDTRPHGIAGLGDLSAAQIVEIRDGGGAVVLSGEFRSRVDAVGNTEKDAELTDQQGRTSIGEVEIELPAPGRDHLRPELEVDVIHLQPRQRYSIAIDDRIVGTFTTDDRGSVDLELQAGEAPALPPAQ
jgi:hypothetical protein